MKGIKAGMIITYDVNGNMIKDLNKGIGGIAYNHLNLPEAVNVTSNKGDGTGTISYIYDATGIKLKKTAPGNMVTEYSGNYVYKNGTLEFINHAEGYVEKENNTYKYYYQYKDHLGNIRVSYDNSGSVSSPNASIVEEHNYYPFGLEHKGYNNVVNGTEHPYKYNGKELNEELGLDWYDYGARNYDAALGRWMNLDPLAEQMCRHSPYNFAFNNPLRFIDPDGMAPEDIIIKGGKEFRERALADLQQLTDDKLQIDGNGKVTISDTGCNDGCDSGSGLVADLINSDKTTTIQETSGSNVTDIADVESSKMTENGPGEGSDSTINYNPNSTEGGVDVNGSMERPAEIGLAHELGHARDAAQGTQDYGESNFVSPYEENANDGVWYAPNTYSPLDNSEVKVRRLENRVRAEQGVPLRKFTTKKQFKWKGKF